VDCSADERRRGAGYASLDLRQAGRSERRRVWRRTCRPLLFSLADRVARLRASRGPENADDSLPSVQQTLILAIDVSLSMSADDVDPNRLTAAQVAAKAFIEDRPADVRVGLVAFGGNAIVVQQPTSNREDLLAAIDRFQLQRGTATGSALYAALATLLPDAGIDLAALEFKWGETCATRETRASSR
jgi:Ca-activated chloride channel family protein